MNSVRQARNSFSGSSADGIEMDGPLHVLINQDWIAVGIDDHKAGRTS
jgi:hypothetical protein